MKLPNIQMTRGGILVLIVLSGASAQAQTTSAAAVELSSNAKTVMIDEASVTDPAVRSLYGKTGWHALWSAANAEALDEALSERTRHGLDHIVFLAASLTDAGAAGQDIARTKAALAYAGSLAAGRVDPATLYQVYTLPRPKADLAVALGNALRAGRLLEWFNSLPPQDAEYEQISKAYLTFNSKRSVSGPTQVIPAGVIRIGGRDERVPAIRAYLLENGYLSSVASAETNASSASDIDLSLYTQAMADALKKLQAEDGIVADGVIGPETLKILNFGADGRARALSVALERRRWLARIPPETRIDVNTAAANLRYFHDGVLVDERKVIVGEPGRETPSLSSPIYRLVANPTWTVPKSIQNGELANVGAEYLDAHDMAIHDGWIVQRPGPLNALGLVKFDMANNHAIYLHDTSAPALFSRSQRHLSHGCVRVDDALGFARILAKDEGVAEAWQTAQTTGETTYVSLPHRIPVRLLYHTVFVDAGGAIAFRADPYGWNDPIAEQLGFGKAATNRAHAQAIDIGP